MSFHDNFDLWTGYLSLLDAATADNEKDTAKIDISKRLIIRILDDAPEWDAFTKITRKNLEGMIIEVLHRKSPSGSDVRKLFLFLVRCARERQINTSSVPQGVEKEAIQFYALRDDLVEDEERERDYLENGFIRSIVSGIGISIDEKTKEVDSKFSSWNNQLEGFEKRLKESQSLVDRYQKQFNFVGLSKAFQELTDRKTREQKRHLILLLALAILLIVPPLLQLFFRDADILGLSAAFEQPLGLFRFLPLVIFEGLFLYFFRVVLKNYYSVKAQVLQLELRYSICAFVEGYADFVQSKGLFKGGESALSKFEALIFSGIAADESKIPNTFDGLEQITDLIERIKK